ncbi:MAG: hypothetical protein QW104_04400, partial [Nitrososphaerota archaeon]
IVAYSDLILYDRHVVFRSYATGTKAGTIIKDLAALETGVDVTNVDEATTPALNSQWDIQNEAALKIMQSVARGTNYWLRMKPGKILYFKPKTVGTAAATINDVKVISAEYSEDRWRLKNRVIYVGKDGQVLADVSEGAGDLPVVVHDPFLTDAAEAQRRAQIRLALNREYGKQLSVEMHQDDFEALGIDLGDTVTVNLPSLGLNNINMFLLEIEYEPRGLKYSLTLGGKLEMFEEFFEERVGGDVAARFGGTVSIPEYVTTVVSATSAAVRIQAGGRTVRLVNPAPLALENAVNVVLDENGYAGLASGFTSGSFTFSCLPPSELFTRWLRAIYVAENNEGAVSVDILDGANNTLFSNISADYIIPYIPAIMGMWTEQNASDWGVENGVVSDAPNGIVGFYSIKATKTNGSTMKIYYPKTAAAGLDLRGMRYLVIYLFSLSDDASLKLRLRTNAANYYEAVINHSGGAWRRYEVKISTMMAVGSPDISDINYLEIETSLAALYIDTDYVFVPVKRETLRMKFSLSRPSATAVSPKIKLAKFVWREGR